MSKKVNGLVIALVALVLVAPANAGGWKRNHSTDDWTQSSVALTDAEVGHLMYMREEEKLARDVYLMLYRQYATAIFSNISESEQRHMDAMEGLIVKYGLEDPVVSDDVGAFTNPVFSDLYESLVEQGMENYCEALGVGIKIEELDIVDIGDALKEVAAQDLERALNNLLFGSKNHLNAFTRQYDANSCE